MHRIPLTLLDPLRRSPLGLIGEDGPYRPPITQRSPLKMLRNIQTQAVKTRQKLNFPPKPKTPDTQKPYDWEKHHPPGSETKEGKVVTPGALSIVKDIEKSMQPKPKPPAPPKNTHSAAQKAVAKTMRPVHDELAARKTRAEREKRRQEAERAREERRQEGLRRAEENKRRREQQKQAKRMGTAAVPTFKPLSV